MTAFGNFIPPEDADFVDEPINPVVFGIELSPTILGGLIALVGIGAAGYAFVKLVQPVAQANATLRQEIATKEGQLVSQQQQLADIAAVDAALEAAMVRRRSVYSLFANEETIDTLLLDINQRVESSNAALNGVRSQVQGRGIPPILVEAKLKTFTPGEATVISDGSLGEGVNGKLKRETYSLQFSGDYAQTQSILRNLERLEPLLLMRDFSLTSSEPVPETVIGSGGQVVVSPKVPIETSFQLDVLMPVGDVNVPPEVAPPEPPPVEGEAVPPDAPVEGAEG